MKQPYLTRRRFLRSALGATAVATVGWTSTARAGDLPPTESNIEGPYYRPGAPFRNQLYPDDEPGTWLLVWGQVLATDATPLSGALVDVWQADNDGVYDNTTPDYRGRGVQLADDDGLWWIWTVWPGYYPGRTKHIHFKASQQGYRFLTSQLYFRDDPLNARDPNYRPSLELDWFELEDYPGAYGAVFNIVLAAE
jgi:protocatechuate 3,4-dioxygenase beta subunit